MFPSPDETVFPIRFVPTTASNDALHLPNNGVVESSPTVIIFSRVKTNFEEEESPQDPGIVAWAN